MPCPLKMLLVAAAVSASACGAAPQPGSAEADVQPARFASDAAPAPNDPSAPEAPAIREITVPAGTELSVRLDSAVSSKTSAIEDPIDATLRRAVVVDGTTVIPEGAAISGHVTEAERAGRVEGRARIGMRFTTVRIGDERYRIRTGAIAREGRATKKEDAAKIGIGAGAGAITGAIVGGKKGAAIGTAVGAGGGTAVVLATRGEDVSLPAGTAITARLAEPVIVRLR